MKGVADCVLISTKTQTKVDCIQFNYYPCLLYIMYAWPGLGSGSRSTSPRWYQLDINLYFITFNLVKHFLHCLDVGSCDEYKIRICLLQSQSTLTIIKSPQCRKWGGEEKDHSVSIGVGERNSKPISVMRYTMKAGLMM